MKVIRQIGSLAFVLGLFTCIFAGVPWHVVAAARSLLPLRRYPCSPADVGHRTKDRKEASRDATANRV